MITDKTYQRDQVVEIINSVLGQIPKPADEGPYKGLNKELGELKDIIEALQSQLRQTKAHEISETHIPTATDELDAVLGATEEATHTIMEACEDTLEVVKAADAEIFSKVEQHIVKIFEACTFQDITGQRIKKVASFLKQIDEKTASVLNVLEVGDPVVETNGEDTDPTLLNGPALPQNAMSQDEIDALLAEFD